MSEENIPQKTEWTHDVFGITHHLEVVDVRSPIRAVLKVLLIACVTEFKMFVAEQGRADLCFEPKLTDQLLCAPYFFRTIPCVDVVDLTNWDFGKLSLQGNR